MTTNNYKVLKAQVECGFLTNDICNNYLYLNIRDDDFSFNDNKKKKDFFDRHLTIAKAVKYNKIDGNVTSIQIRKLPNFNKSKFNKYMEIEQQITDDSNKGESLLSMLGVIKNDIIDYKNESEDEDESDDSYTDLKDIDRLKIDLRQEILIEMKKRFESDDKLTIYDFFEEIAPF